MTGPPTGSWGETTFVFAGANLPYGAACTFGHQWAWADVDELQEWVTEFFTPVVTDLVEGTCNNQTRLDYARFKQGPVSIGPAYNYPMDIPGDQTDDPESPQVAGIVKKVVPDISGRHWGRMFWPGLSETSVESAGVLATTTLEQWQPLFADLYDQYVAQGAIPAVFHGGSGDPHTVAGLLVDSRVGTIRRRMRR